MLIDNYILKAWKSKRQLQRLTPMTSPPWSLGRYVSIFGVSWAFYSQIAQIHTDLTFSSGAAGCLTTRSCVSPSPGRQAVIGLSFEESMDREIVNRDNVRLDPFLPLIWLVFVMKLQYHKRLLNMPILTFIPDTTALCPLFGKGGLGERPSENVGLPGTVPFSFEGGRWYMGVA